MESCAPDGTMVAMIHNTQAADIAAMDLHKTQKALGIDKATTS